MYPLTLKAHARHHVIGDDVVTTPTTNDKYIIKVEWLRKLFIDLGNLSFVICLEIIRHPQREQASLYVVCSKQHNFI